MDIYDRKTHLSEGRFELSRHAFKRVVERNISDKEIMEAGRNAEIIEDYPSDKYSPSCLVLGFTLQHRPFHIQVCYVSTEMLKIITLYEPDPLRWISFRKRRKEP